MNPYSVEVVMVRAATKKYSYIVRCSVFSIFDVVFTLASTKGDLIMN